MNTNIRLREYIDADFPTVETWWRAHHGNDFRPSYPARASFIVTMDGRDVGFFGMCPMTPAFCYLSFPLVDPDADREARDKAVDFIIDCAKLWAVNAGIPIVYYSGNGVKFLSRLRDKGFVAGETGCQHMFATVGEIL